MRQKRQEIEYPAKAAAALIAGGLAAAPLFGLWPLVGVIAACVTAFYIIRPSR